MENLFQFLAKYQSIFFFFFFLETFLLLFLGAVFLFLRRGAAKTEREKEEIKNELTREVNFCLVPLGKKGVFTAQIEMIIQGGELKKIKTIPQTTSFTEIKE